MRKLPLALLVITAAFLFAFAHSRAQEQWIPRTSGTTAHLWGVAYGGGANALWVAVGEQGTILTSPNAATWTPRYTGFAARRFLGVAYGRGLWVAVGGTEPLSENLAVIVTSPDGITWTPRVTTGVRFNNVAFGNGTFVAVTDLGDLWSSLDGLTWKPAASGPGRYLRGLAYGAPTFVTTGLSGLRTTYDGSSPTDRFPSAGQLEGVAWGRNQFVAVGTAGLTYTSPDGLAWTQQPTTTTLTAHSATFFINQFIAVGTTGIATSFDGSVWTNRPAPLGPDVILLGVASGASSVVAVGRFGTILHSLAASVPLAIATQPKPVTEIIGGNVAFSVTVSGTSMFSYQWQRNGTPVPGATAATLFLRSVQTTQTGSYTCTITNGIDTMTSAAATLTVLTRTLPLTVPSIVSPNPASLYREVRDGESVSIEFDLIGSSPFTEQLTSPSGLRREFQTGQVYFVPKETGLYSLTATNPLGTSAPQQIFVRVVPTAPFDPNVITPARTNTYTISRTGTQTVRSVALGTRPFTFQWFHNGIAIPGATNESFTVAPAAGYGAGNYHVVVSNLLGSAAMPPYIFHIYDPGIFQPPVFVTHPVSTSAVLGGGAAFQVVAKSSSPLAYQWYKDAIPIPGATAATYTITSVTAADAGAYTVRISSTELSQPAILTVLPSARLTNLAVRTTLASNQLLTVGFTMQGGEHVVLLRAVGPGLTALGVTGAMADPRLTLFDRTSTAIAANDNWSGFANTLIAMTQVGAFPFSGPLSFDAALVREISGSHTVQTSGPSPGTVLVEVYDLGSKSTAPRLTNLSALNHVGTGADVLIAGFTLSGSGTRTLLIRAVGPSLTPLGVPTVLADPKLELFDAQQTKLAENDTYAPSLTTTFTAVGAFALLPNARDAALLATLPPGAYTCVVSGVNNTTGTALVEVYEVP